MKIKYPGKLQDEPTIIINGQNEKLKKEIDDEWTKLHTNTNYQSKDTRQKTLLMEHTLGTIERYDSRMLVHPLEYLQDIPPSIMLTNVLDKSLLITYIFINILVVPLRPWSRQACYISQRMYFTKSRLTYITVK